MKFSHYMLAAKAVQEAQGWPRNPTIEESYSQMVPLRAAVDEAHEIIEVLRQEPGLIQYLQVVDQRAAS